MQIPSPISWSDFDSGFLGRPEGLVLSCHPILILVSPFQTILKVAASPYPVLKGEGYRKGF
jgi:hypothetical protein